MVCFRKYEIVMERASTKLAVLLWAFLVIELTGYTLAAAETKIEEIVGKIVSIDITENMLTIETKQGEMSISVNEKTQITMGREEKYFSDLKVGEKVKVHYTIVDGKELAERIMVRPCKKKSPTEGVFEQ
jgi:RNase P/RNase MRP subunit p29